MDLLQLKRFFISMALIKVIPAIGRAYNILWVGYCDLNDFIWLGLLFPLFVIMNGLLLYWLQFSLVFED